MAVVTARGGHQVLATRDLVAGRGRPVLPPMPIAMYRHMTDEDLEAVFTYLQSIPAIKNRVPEPLPPAAQGSAVAASPAS